MAAETKGDVAGVACWTMASQMPEYPLATDDRNLLGSVWPEGPALSSRGKPKRGSTEQFSVVLLAR